jgi:protein-serine/threonine kinase
MNVLADNNQPQTSLNTSYSSLDLAEDLSRFPSESLHSFSFAHQSDEFLHARQNVLKRSLEIMRDRMGRSMPSSSAALASAQARASGDLEAQNVLELLARAQFIEAGNLPNPSSLVGPLTGPALPSGANPFEQHFAPQCSTPDMFLSPAATGHPVAGNSSDCIEPLDLSATDRTRSSKGPNGLPPTSHVAHDLDSQGSSRTLTNESGTTSKTSPSNTARPISLKRTLTDTMAIAMHERLVDTLGQPFLAGQPGAAAADMLASPTVSQHGSSFAFPGAVGPAVHGHTNRWVPAAQAIFTTEARPPWTILAANDLACLVFGVTKAEMRRVGILEVVQEERRDWLERKLLRKAEDDGLDATPRTPSAPKPRAAEPAASGLLGGRSGITAQLLSKPNSRSQTPKSTGKRAQTVHSGDPSPPRTSAETGDGHRRNGSRSVLLCGDVVPIQKRNGATGSASLWVKEKKVGLIWVLEEIHEDVAIVTLGDDEGCVGSLSGASTSIWGLDSLPPNVDVARLIPRIPRQGIDPRTGEIDFAQISRRKYFTCPNAQGISIPCKIEQVRGKLELRVSSFPHMAGIVVVCPRQLTIKSSNSVFCGALFGHEKPDGMSIGLLLPDFGKILDILTENHGMELVDGTVIPEHSFRKASASLGLREGRPDGAACFLSPEGLAALHRDGSDLRIDVQMRVVKSEKPKARPKPNSQGTQSCATGIVPGAKPPSALTNVSNSRPDPGTLAPEGDDAEMETETEVVYALWITYSRHLHANRPVPLGGAVPPKADIQAPLRQPSPGQSSVPAPPQAMTPGAMTERTKSMSSIRSLDDKSNPADDGLPARDQVDPGDDSRDNPSVAAMFTKQLRDVAMTAATKLTGGVKQTSSKPDKSAAVTRVAEPTPKKTIDDFAILEDMGQGAFGQVKLARYKNNGKKVVLKYVTKRRILVDTWTRDRKLGTVPLEIHVLSFLRRPELRHPNIVEMESFFEDDINYYIEMVPHGLPGMDLFDYIELRSNMDEDECRSIFVQVAHAIHHLHTRALVVHRDIKDENVILDGEGNIKLIDFGSAAYIKSGPFDVFVGTIGEFFGHVGLS